MPSYRYTRDIAPQPPRPTAEKPDDKKEKAVNWWHYHWKGLVALLLLLAVIVYVAADLLSTPKADYVIGIIGAKELDETFVEQLTQQLAAVCGDRNGDGKAVVQLLPFALEPDDGGGDAAESAARLSVLLDQGKVSLFFVDAGCLAGLDDFGLSAADGGITPLSDMPALRGLPLPDNYLVLLRDSDDVKASRQDDYQNAAALYRRWQKEAA